MAELVATLGVPHTPLLWELMRNDIPDDLAAVGEHFERFRRILEEARPDVLVMIASDHFRQLLTSNMPAFMIGKASWNRCTHPNEERMFALPRCGVPGHPGLARRLLGGRELPSGFDFAFSDEPWLDHAFVVPLLYLRPRLDLPVVPIFTNANAPPIPSARRFAQVGDHVRRTILEWDADVRVAVVGSGHLAVELGGPRQFGGASPDPEFDRAAVSWIEAGDVDAAIEGATFDRMFQAGNLTFQFLNLVSCLAVAGGRPPSVAAGVECRFGAEPFIAWEGEG